MVSFTRSQKVAGPLLSPPQAGLIKKNSFYRTGHKLALWPVPITLGGEVQMFCKKFRQEIPKGEEFCPFCGKRVRISITTSDPIFTDGFSKEKLKAEIERLISEGWRMTYPLSSDHIGIKKSAGIAFRSGQHEPIPETTIYAEFEKDC